MSDPQFIRSSTPHHVEVAEGSRNAKSKSGTIGTEAQQEDSNSTVFVDADLPTESRTLYIDEQSADVVASGQGSTNATNTSANSGADVQHADTKSRAFIHADAPAEIKTVFFDKHSTVAARAPQQLEPAEVNAPPLSSTTASPVSAAPVALYKPDKKSHSAGTQAKSQFSGQIGELKAKNDHVRAELKRRESAASAKT